MLIDWDESWCVVFFSQAEFFLASLPINGYPPAAGLGRILHVGRPKSRAYQQRVGFSTYMNARAILNQAQ